MPFLQQDPSLLWKTHAAAFYRIVSLKKRFRQIKVCDYILFEKKIIKYIFDYFTENAKETLDWNTFHLYWMNYVKTLYCKCILHLRHIFPPPADRDSDTLYVYKKIIIVGFDVHSSRCRLFTVTSLKSLPLHVCRLLTVCRLFDAFFFVTFIKSCTSCGSCV